MYNIRNWYQSTPIFNFKWDFRSILEIYFAVTIAEKIQYEPPRLKSKTNALLEN
jgi:hypothetical protein